MAGRNGIFTHAFSESSSKPYGKNGLPRRDTFDEPRMIEARSQPHEHTRLFMRQPPSQDLTDQPRSPTNLNGRFIESEEQSRIGFGEKGLQRRFDFAQPSGRPKYLLRNSGPAATVH